MDEHLKQRLVGALVLVSVAVIFLPLILDGRDQEQAYRDIQMPTEPVVTLDVSVPDVDTSHFEQVKEKVVVERQDVAPAEPVLDTEPEPLPKPKVAKQAAKEAIEKVKEKVKAKPSKPVERLSEAFTIQLAAFSSRDNAEKLHQRLIKKDYAAYVQKGSSGGKTLYRVFVGPEIRKNRALIVAEALNKEFGLKGMVVRYAP